MNNNTLIIDKYEFTINSQDVDFTGKASLVTIGNIFLNVAGMSAIKNKFGISDLNKSGLTWVTLRLKISVKRYPDLSEKISAETWIENSKGLTTQRNCIIKDSKGNTIVEISTLFVIMDLKTRQLMKMDMLPDYDKFVVGDKYLLLQSPEKIKTLTNTKEIAKHTVVYSDIDSNMHVNTLQYIIWMLNTFSLKTYSDKQISECEINYMHEALFGETVTLYREDATPDCCIFEIQSEDARILNRCKIIFQSK